MRDIVLYYLSIKLTTMEKYKMPAEIDRLQSEADKLLEDMNGDNIIERMANRSHLLIRIGNLKKWIARPSYTEAPINYGVTYIGKTAI